MQIKQITQDLCAEQTGLVVVIDVLRAFTTAAFALAAGAADIVLVGSVEEAFALRQKWPQALIMGEVNGRQVPGFDFGNSPSALLGQELDGRRLIHRTSAGTQGVVRSVNAAAIFTASFVCAQATVEAIRALQPPEVTFVNTDNRPGGYGDEDAACSDYLSALLRGEQPDPTPYLDRVRESINGRLFADPAVAHLPAADLACALELDRFDFAMPVKRQNGWHVLTAVTGRKTGKVSQ
ncbi:MAG: 2-phosphosulfolactate phosphatase [Anaerolineales bacterium]|nr:2-phosphosulfolactate phosphatase [Anaerolineales bacterium]